MACIAAESKPPLSGSVVDLVAAFLSAIIDDAAICRTYKTQDKISHGNCEVAKSRESGLGNRGESAGLEYHFVGLRQTTFASSTGSASCELQEISYKVEGTLEML